ncbi:unnamed protein product [Zymoseptoria tritici ST99CH_1E4]|uniref:T6SS Phospholipase effector Tle1-like catalytic domain-containing protein n=1 Tax=Zymoseptoria tritici ST99CH_1E4 TaxID=1276532 RepID=A0A2H1FWV9_ZYMTR|nr:unnamed protein product [Zymoseptoria tritici ST99CH_1E4]
MSRPLSAAEQQSLIHTPRRNDMNAPPEQYPPPRPGKRLILCEDGTWLNSAGETLSGALDIPSNITRLSRAIKAVSSDGIQQVVYYHQGIGAGGGITNRIVGGATGKGLAENVREGYAFLATNYVPGDEVYIFGFSRGAFTARSIAGLIGDVGMLSRDGLPFFPEIFKDVRNKHDENYRPKHPDVPFPNKPSALDSAYAKELQRRGLTRLGVRIKVVGVWDTVGALGTPKIGWLTRLGLQSSSMRELSFYDTSLDDCIEHAFQALALDERRFAFPPALWEKLEGNQTTLRQVWFPGAHSNVGGGYEDQQIATISLAWMMSQCQPFLDFDLDYIHDEWEQNEMEYEEAGEKIRPWSFGKIFSGMDGIYALGGTKIRTPGRYCAYNPANGKATDDPLIETHEYIHPSVRSRMKLHGPGLDDRGEYKCEALNDWKLVIEWPEGGAKRPTVYWRAREKPASGFVKTLPEAPLWALETELLRLDPETEAYIMKPSGVRRKSQRLQQRSSSARSAMQSGGDGAFDDRRAKEREPETRGEVTTQEIG